MHNAQFLSQSFTYFIFFTNLSLPSPQPLQVLIIPPHAILNNTHLSNPLNSTSFLNSTHIQHVPTKSSTTPNQSCSSGGTEFLSFCNILIDLAYPWFIFPPNFLMVLFCYQLLQIRNKLLCQIPFAQKLFCLLPELFF